MQNIPGVTARADNGKMDFKDEIEDEFDDLNSEHEVKSEVEGDRISLKSPINKDAFDIVDEFMGDDDNNVKVNGNLKTDSDENGDVTDEINDNINGDFNPIELCESSEMLEEGTASIDEDEEGGEEDHVDPLMDEGTVENAENEKPAEQNSGKRKMVEESDDGAMVRKSSRLRSKAESREEKEAAAVQEKPKEKQKMLQKPSERPMQIGIDEEDVETENSDMEAPEDAPDADKENIEQLGDASREPGNDAKRLIDYDFLLPFFHGWVRECVYKELKVGPAVIENVYYWPPSSDIDQGPAKNREARRKRRNKHDQERYFEDFPSSKLSVCNFSYVKRELGLNNEAYEKITNAKPGAENRAEDVRRSTRKVASYKEVAEHEGLLESDHSETESSDGGVEEVTDFDIGLPLTLQIQTKVTPYREEHRKRRKYPDRRRCVTPPLAADISNLQSQLDDDPLGVWTELQDDYLRDGPPQPAVPPQLAAVRLTHPGTVSSVAAKLGKIRAGLADPLLRITAENKDLRGSDHLATHDLAIRKYKHQPQRDPTYRPPVCIFVS